ncbi:hypothetical protein KXD40_004699 [Peronospora effusa]|uniref:Elicitin n=1 Tax=Peronospora effusa TaxID=542832 RepID=A0A3M6VS28_9STRA|nr:hypothetical protein DD238_003772 [Peronospora effusa]RQM10127.1 hypothetical protein DD237_005291 [Peronospora effusa]UIZ27837.1 hypothetical protein KXD40_004699 [Peronospora effusa]CAI5721352.1 unnamed protein product [Peronospora effusa]
MSTIVTTAQECPPDISQPLIAAIDNSAYFDTCAKGTTFNVKSVFDVLQFTSKDFMTFCSSSTCLEPIHKNMKPLDCNITYMGTSRNLSMEISELHEKCHQVRDAAEGSAHDQMDKSKSMDMNGNNNANTPGDATTVSSDASSIVLMTGSMISAAILAVFMA